MINIEHTDIRLKDELLYLFRSTENERRYTKPLTHCESKLVRKFNLDATARTVTLYVQQ